ncbi:MAG: YfiR family protein [Methylovulum sp.]|nr:YfiR family protein [Methylovulum sp.]
MIPKWGMALFALWVVIDGSAGAEDLDLHEDEVKAGFVYNFAKFVEWPEDTAHAYVNLCIVGDSPFGFAALKAIDGRRVTQDKQLVTKLLNKSDDLTACQIIFIAASERGNMAQLLKSAHQQHTLTVSDIEGFAQAGGAIGLVNADGKIRFAINLLAAKDAGVLISSRLLALAMIVYDEHNIPLK